MCLSINTIMNKSNNYGCIHNILGDRYVGHKTSTKWLILLIEKFKMNFVCLVNYLIFQKFNKAAKIPENSQVFHITRHKMFLLVVGKFNLKCIFIV